MKLRLPAGRILIRVIFGVVLLPTFDPEGSCSDGMKRLIEAAFKDGCKKAQDGKCFDKCKGHSGAGEKMCENGASGITIKCGADRDGDCQTIPFGRCGNTPENKGFKVVVICPSALNPDSCGGLECTVIHELVHTIGGKDYQHPNPPTPQDIPNQVESCMGCPQKRKPDVWPQPPKTN